MTDQTPEVPPELQPQNGEPPTAYLGRMAHDNQARLEECARDGFAITGIEEMRRTLLDDALIERFIGQSGTPERIKFEIRFQVELSQILLRAQEKIRVAKWGGPMPPGAGGPPPSAPGAGIHVAR